MSRIVAGMLERTFSGYRPANFCDLIDTNPLGGEGHAC